MAFAQANFAPVSTRSTNTPGMWLYRTTDTLLEVSNAGYFDNKVFQLEVGDSIYCVTSTGIGFLTWQGQGQPSQSIALAGDASGPITVLQSSTTAAQAPTALDTPIQVDFGGPVAGTGVDLDANGTVTIGEKGNYRIRALFSQGRTTTPGVAVLGLRLLLNGVQQGNSAWTRLDDGDFTIPEEFTLTQQLQAGDTIEIELVRDGLGVNNGGLLSVSPSVVPWNPSSSASITVARYF